MDRFHSSQGAAALITVLGVMVVMLVIAATVGFQARQELRMSKAETGAAEMELLVLGAFSQIAADAWNKDYNPNDDAAAACPPPPPPNTEITYPVVCKTVLFERKVATSDAYKSMPVRVVYQGDATAEQQVFYGWVLRWWNTDGTVKDVKVYHYYFWCPPAPNATLGPCKSG